MLLYYARLLNAFVDEINEIYNNRIAGLFRQAERLPKPAASDIYAFIVKQIKSILSQEVLYACAVFNCNFSVVIKIGVCLCLFT